MKNHIKYIKLIGVFLLALVTSVACVKWEEEPTYDVGAPSTVTINLLSVGDSSITISVSNSAEGFVAVNLFDGTGLAVPEDEETLEALLTGNVNSMSYLTVQAAPGEVYPLTFAAGIVQDAAYDIIAVANNTDGVVSAGQIVTAVTSDSYAPVFIESDPVPATDDIIEIGQGINLYFDEPVVEGTITDSIFYFTGLFSGAMTPGVVEISGNMVTVTPETDFAEGEYIFLSWNQGAVTDPTGNPVMGMQSYYSSGFAGLYFRMVRPPREPISVGPEADSIAIGGAIDIVFDDAVVADLYLTQGMIELQYHYSVINEYDERVWHKRDPIYVRPENLVFDGNTVTIPQGPSNAQPGDLLEVIVAEEAFDIGFYVPNAAIEAGTWRLY